MLWEILYSKLRMLHWKESIDAPKKCKSILKSSNEADCFSCDFDTCVYSIVSCFQFRWHDHYSYKLHNCRHYWRPLVDRSSDRQVTKLGFLSSTLFTSPPAFCFVLCVLAAMMLYGNVLFTFRLYLKLREDGHSLRIDGELVQYICALESYVHQRQACVSNIHRFSLSRTNWVTKVTEENVSTVAAAFKCSIILAGISAQAGWGPPVVHRYAEYLQDKRTLQAVLGTVKWKTFPKGLDRGVCYAAASGNLLEITASSERQPFDRFSERCLVWGKQCVACTLSRAPFV